MKYTKFRIKNFKWVKWILDLDLTNLPNSNIFTLVWLNESWKTSLLEAINLLHNKISDSDAHKMIHKSEKWNFNDKISVTAFIELDEDDEKRISDYCKKEINFTLSKKIEKIELKKEYTFKNSQFDSFSSIWTIPLVWKTPKWKKDIDLHKKDKNLWNKVVKYIEDNFPPILYYENFLFDFPQKIYLKEFEWETKEEAEYRKIFQDILDSFNKWLTIEEHILNRLNNQSEENTDALESIIWDISQKLTEVIFNWWNDVFLKSNKEIELKIPKDEERGFYVQLKIKQWKDRFYINERSLWFRWFFSFLLFTEFRKERKEDFWEALFLLDEPASNLHQKSQQKLLWIFERLAEKCKIIYSTHSHHLINPKYLAWTYIVKNEAINYDNEENFDQNETKINATLYKNFISKYPKEIDHFKPILDSIDYIPSNFELQDDIVCLEWKNDYYTFKYFQDIVFNWSYNFKFYPWASVSKFSDLFRLYISWNKSFYWIFDSDKQWKKEKSRYINEISSELEDKIFTLDDIDKSWINFTTEDLFTENDKIKIIKSLFEKEDKYTKSKFNTALQDIFINNKNITLEDDTVSNIKKVLDFLKNKFN